MRIRGFWTVGSGSSLRSDPQPRPCGPLNLDDISNRLGFTVVLAISANIRLARYSSCKKKFGWYLFCTIFFLEFFSDKYRSVQRILPGGEEG